MANQPINLGTAPLGEDGDTVRAAFTKVNENTAELYGSKLDNTDPRLTNAREWTAETVTQEEAEEGASTTRRAWTAQRVRQAIAAWWAGVSTVFGRSLVSAANSADGRALLAVREQLTANRTYFVRTDGSDANNGLANTAGGAFLTIQRAVDAAASVDIGIYKVTIKIADGAYNDNVILKKLTGSGECVIEGNLVTPSNVTITPPAPGPDNSIFSTGGGLGGSTYRVSGFRTSSAVASNHFRVRNGSLFWSRIETGTGAICFISDAGAYMAADGDWTISGNQNAHFRATSGGVIFAQGRTVNISGAVSFGSTGPLGFVSASRASTVILNTVSFIGSATGRRFFSEANAVIDTLNSGLSYLPGDIDGLTQTGGQYL